MDNGKTDSQIRREEMIDEELKKPETWELARQMHNVGAFKVNQLTFMVAAALSLSHGKQDVPVAEPNGSRDEWQSSFVRLAENGTELPEL